MAFYFFHKKGGELKMASIQSSIMIHDMMSQQFMAINMAMATVIESFQTLQDVTGEAIDVSALNNAQRELQMVEANFKMIEEEIKHAENAQEDLNKDIQNADKLSRTLLRTLGSIVGTYLTLQAIGNAINLSDEMTNTVARLDLINDNLQTTEELQRMIFDSAKRTYAPYLQTADLVGKLAMNASDAFDSTAEIVAFSELLNKSFANAGTNAEGIASATLQLTQALGAGILRGEELNAVLEAAPTIIQNIEKYLGISRTELREMATQGQITAEIVKASMFAAADDINRKFNTMPVTWSQIWTNFKSEALWAFRPVLEEINSIANNEKFQEFVNSVQQSLYTLAHVTLSVLDIFISIGSFVYDNWSIIATTIGIATTALGLFTAAIIANKIATGLSIAIQTAKAIAIAVTTGATIAQTAATHNLTVAQWALNSAMLASPITWIIVLIFILIGAFYLAIAIVNHFRDTNISATGIIAGVFMFLYAHIYNIIANLWNIFAALAEFFVNVWNHPMYSVKQLFYNLATNVLDHTLAMSKGWDGFATSFVNAIISAVNMAIRAWNSFIELLPDAVTSFLGLSVGAEISHRQSITSDLQKIKGYLDNWVGEAPEDYWIAPRMEHMNYGDSWNKGYNWGANLFSGFELDAQNQNFTKDLLSTLNGINDTINMGNMAGKDIAGNTEKLTDSVDLLEEDLKYLRDIAERESVNRYTTAEINVNMKNENYINNETDIDGIIDRFGEKVEEVIENLAEGDDEFV